MKTNAPHAKKCRNFSARKWVAQAVGPVKVAQAVGPVRVAQAVGPVRVAQAVGPVDAPVKEAVDSADLVSRPTRLWRLLTKTRTAPSVLLS